MQTAVKQQSLLGRVCGWRLLPHACAQEQRGRVSAAASSTLNVVAAALSLAKMASSTARVSAAAARQPLA